MPVRATPLHLFRIRHESFDGTIALRSDLRSSPDTRRVGFGECRVHDPCHVPTPRCSTAPAVRGRKAPTGDGRDGPDRKSTRLNSSHGYISYAVFCLKKKKKQIVRSPA